MTKNIDLSSSTALRDLAYHTPNLDKEIVQKYDIRGRYHINLFDKDAYLIGNSLAGYLLSLNQKHQTKTVVIGHDCRESASSLKKALIEGLTDRGFTIIDLGMVSSPLVNTCVLNPDAYALPCPVEAGVIITASHNPACYNGFKITLQNGLPLFGDELASLCSFASFEFSPSPLSPLSYHPPRPIEEMYCDFLLSTIKQELSFLENKKIIWDVGNGACGKILKTLIKKLPGSHLLIHEKADPNFPSHTPDPSQEKNILPLRESVVEHHADIGFALDMDGDRLGVIDKNGKYWNGDLLSYLFAEHLCQTHQGAHIYLDVKSSQAILDQVHELGGKATIVPTGHALIKSLLKTNSSVLFAGEYSGHHYFPKEYCLVDDAVYSALRVLLIDKDFPLDQRYNSLRKYESIPQKSLTFASHKEKETAMAQISELVKGHPTLDINLVDGLRARFEAGWWLIRASNTEPILTLRCEGKTLKALKEIQENLDQLLAQLKIEPTTTSH